MIIGVDANGLQKILIKFPCNGYYLRWYYNGWHYWWFLPGTIDYQTEGEEYFTIGTQKIAMCSGQIDYYQCQAIRTILNAIEISIWTDVGWKSLKLERDSVIVYDNKINGYEIEFIADLGSRNISELDKYANGYSPVDDIPVIPPAVWVPDCANNNCVIGTQVWTSCNYSDPYPGSRVYDDDEANRIIWGGLYTWNQIMASGFVPTGWHIPTVAEVNTLIASGAVLKDSDTTYWDVPNAVASPESCFEARGAGLYNIFNGVYDSLGDLTFIWTTGDFGLTAATLRLDHDSNDANISYIDKDHYASVRLIRDTPAGPADLVYAGYGALYNWFTILGLNIYIYTGDGGLYNWWAASKNGGTGAGSIAPLGWHVPTKAEYITLMKAIDPAWTNFTNVAGGHMKIAGTTYWTTPNTGADDTSGFNARGSGIRNDSGVFASTKLQLRLWTSESFNATQAKTVLLNYNSAHFSVAIIGDFTAVKKYGHSIRLIKDDSDLGSGYMTDIDGNSYTTVKIGTQVWMATNLTVENYNDGTPVTIEPNAVAWAALTTEGMCYYV